MTRLARVWRALRAAQDQVAYAALTLSVLVVGYLTAIEARGEPARSFTVLLLLIGFAFLTGWLHEMYRPGGSNDLAEELDRLRSDAGMDGAS